MSKRQVIVSAFSLLVGSIGVATCIHSLTLQVQQIGDTTAAICWFAGLFAVILAISGYVVVNLKQPPRLSLSILVGAILSALAVILETMYFYTFQIITIDLVAIICQAVLLVIVHFLLKAEDSQAL